MSFVKIEGSKKIKSASFIDRSVRRRVAFRAQEQRQPSGQHRIQLRKRFEKKKWFRPVKRSRRFLSVSANHSITSTNAGFQCHLFIFTTTFSIYPSSHLGCPSAGFQKVDGRSMGVNVESEGICIPPWFKDIPP